MSSADKGLEARLATVLADAARRPGGPVPDWADVGRRARRRRTRRAVAVGSLILLLAGGAGLAGVGAFDRSRSTRIAAEGAADTDLRPVLRACEVPGVTIRAQEGTTTGTGLTVPPRDGEVFAVPNVGASGPLAVLLRSPASAGPPVLIPNTTIAGLPANVQDGPQGQGGVSWQLADGSSARLSFEGLTGAEARALAEAITTQAGVLPAGLVSIGTTTGATATWARSQCSPPQGSLFGVEAVRGSPASRYAHLVASAPGLRWDDGAVSYVAFGTGVTPTTRPAIRQATPDEWKQYLSGAPSPTTSKEAPTTTGAPSSAKRGGTLRVLAPDEPVLLDSAKFDPSRPGAQLVFRSIYGSLFSEDATGAISPALASSLTTSDGGSSWTLRLRTIKFSDGTPVDAAAVKFNWDRLADPRTGAPAGALAAAAQVRSAVIVDPVTLTITLPAADTTFPSALTGTLGCIASPTAIKAAGGGTPGAGQYGNPPYVVGAGPFMASEWRRGIALVLTRNPTYWNTPRPYLDRIEITIQTDVSLSTQTWLDSNADLVWTSRAGDIAAGKARGGQTVNGWLWHANVRGVEPEGTIGIRIELVSLE